MKKKKIMKVIAFVTAIALTLGVAWFANGLLGNPVSKFLATQSAKEYLKENYGETDFVLGEVNYNFKNGRYYARISSPSSIDSHFSLDINLFGEVKRDYYESNVLEGGNTFIRCEDGYRALGDKVFNSPDFPYKSDIDFVSFLDDSEKMDKIEALILELDQEFDYEALGKEFGELTFYAQNEEVTLEKASEIILGLKEIFDREQVYFYEIDFVLQRIGVDGEKDFDGPEIHINNFLYSDIYPEEMLERVTKANVETMAYYEAEDEKAANHVPENIVTR